MSLKETLKKALGWSSLVGLGVFFMGVGIVVWGLMTTLQILTSLRGELEYLLSSLLPSFLTLKVDI